VTAASDTSAAASADLLALNENDPHTTIAALEASPTPGFEIGAAFAGACAQSLKADPGRPCQGLELRGVMAPVLADRWTLTERQTLLADGIATCYVSAGDVVRVERSITTYTTAAGGAGDASMRDAQTLYLLAYLLRDLRSMVETKFGRHKLVSDGTRLGPGVAAVSPSTIKGAILARYRELEWAGLVENYDAFAAALVVERDGTDPNRVNVLYPPDLANMLIICAVLAQFRLQYPALQE
jgi:phage tail sheath gpL-like